MGKKKTLVAIVMGSKSDLPTMREASKALKLFGISHEILIRSAHRTPNEMSAFAKGAQSQGYRVIIAGAGGAAHLPGMIASHTSLPVIGVPVPSGALKGQDSLLSIVQMPKGVPVATVAIGNAWNAGLLAAQILAFGGTAVDLSLSNKVTGYKSGLRKKILKMKV